MSKFVLVNSILKAIVLLVLVKNSCMFESLLCSVCGCECIVFVCTTEKGRKVILGTSLLSKLPLALCSSLQPDLFILCLKRSHFLLRPLPLAVQRCLSVCVHVCVVHVLSVQEHLSQWEKSIFPPKERARQQCQRYWLELATWEARKRWREGGHLGVKGRENLWCDLP